MKQKSTMGSHPRLFEDGLIMGRFNLEEFLQDIEDIESAKKKIKTQSEQISAMLEFLATNKEMILKDKQLFYLQDIQTIKSSKTLVRGLTINDGDFSPFWSTLKGILSGKLWLPQEIVSADLGLNSSNGSVQTMEQKSWFLNKMILPQKKNSVQNSWTSSKCFVPAETGSEDIIRAKKFRVYPKPHQKKLLSKWAHQNRYTFNRTVEDININGMRGRNNIRNDIVTSKNIPDDKKWLLETPKVIRQQAVFRAYSNFKSALENIKRGNIKHFTFEKKRKPLWTLGIEKQLKITSKGEICLFKNKPYSFGSMDIKDKFFRTNQYLDPDSPFDLKENGKMVPKCDSYIHKDQYDRYYLIVPYKIKRPEYKETKIVSLDPGLRKFLVAYSPSGECQYLGVNCRDKLRGLFSKYDRYSKLLQTDLSKKDRKKIMRKRKEIWRKLNDLKRELHDKTINYLTDKYGCIVLGKLNISAIIRKEKRVLRAKEVRSISRLAHYEFRIKLAHKCESRGVKFILADEAWTSKTCGGCGRVNKGLGGSETYKCNNCDVQVDRDINGARNILLKKMGMLTVLRRENSNSNNQHCANHNS